MKSSRSEDATSATRARTSLAAMETLAERRHRGEKNAQSLLERNRFAVGKTATSLVSPRRQQLTPAGPARPLPGTKAIRRAHFRLGHAWRQAWTVSGCLNSAFLGLF